jgi:hypothetical protein
MTKRFAILDASGKVLNVVAFELPVKEFVWPGYGAHWVYADEGERPAPPSKIDAKVTYLGVKAQGSASPGDTVDTKTGVVTPLTPPIPPPPTVDELKSYAAEKRWQVEVGGAPWNGHVVQTDREAQTKLIAEFVAMGAGLRADPSPWKMRGGNFLMLTNEQMGSVIMTVRTHVATAFATEANVLEGVEDKLISNYAQIDNASWPSNT